MIIPCDLLSWFGSKGSAGEQAVRFQILLAGTPGHLRRELRRRRLFVPGDRLEVVADVLLVERRLGLAGRVLRGGQKREESGVSTSSTRRIPSPTPPNSNLLLAIRIPRSAA